MSRTPAARLTVSVVIPHYGDPAPATALVRTLLGGSAVPADLIVVDDASPIPYPHTPGVRVVRRASNGGFGAAVNSGAAVATGDLLLILNSDLEVSATFLEDFLDAYRPWHPTVAGPAVRGPDGSPQWTGRHFPHGAPPERRMARPPGAVASATGVARGGRA